MQGQKSRPQLCWDCAKACGGCSWSRKLIPVKGWSAKKVNFRSEKFKETYMIVRCPEFERDAYKAGLERKKEGEQPFQKEKRHTVHVEWYISDSGKSIMVRCPYCGKKHCHLRPKCDSKLMVFTPPCRSGQCYRYQFYYEK